MSCSVCRELEKSAEIERQEMEDKLKRAYDSAAKTAGLKFLPNVSAPGVLGPEDPWKHRSSSMSCATCMWFVPKAPRTDFGRCRRHAPSMNGYPAVFASDWCGDHKVDETKL